MKRKLRIEELSVASFSTDDDGFKRERGTVLGMRTSPPGYTVADGSCAGWDTCDLSCQGIARTCAATCPETCHATCDDFSCQGTCVPLLC